MTAWRSRLPFPVDPLIAEAKRRMRRRRLLVAAVVALLAAGIGAALALSGSASPHGSVLGPSPAKAHLSPLSGLATRLAFCGNRYSTCHSPDGRWSIVYVNRSPGPVSYNYAKGKVSGYAPPRVGCTLHVANLATGLRKQIHLAVPACDNGIWIGPTYLVQAPYAANPALGRVVSVDPPSRHVTALAHLVNYVVAPNGRWVAGEVGRFNGDAGSGLIVVLSPRGHTCRVVAQTTSPNHYLSIDRSPWESPDIRNLAAKDPVVWHDVAQGGTRIQVVTGPGTGFTRDSRSLILAEWEYANHPPRTIHKRLVKLDLSPLHTPCPASVAIR